MYTPNSNKSATKAKRDVRIDLLRALACIAVIGLHTFNRKISFACAITYYCCGFAVPMFFMVSGAMLLNRGEVSYIYVRKRVISIIRIILCWSLISASARAITGHDWISTPIEFCLLVARVMISSVLQHGALFHMWFLAAISIVYILLPLFSRLTDKSKRLVLFGLTCICISFQAISVNCSQPVERLIPQAFRMWIWLIYFILGGILYNQYGGSDEQTSCKHNVVIPFIAVTILAALMQYYFSTNVVTEDGVMLPAEYMYSNPMFLVWIVLIFRFALALNIPSMLETVSSKLSKHSMGIYLIHPLVIRVLTKLWDAGSFLECLVCFSITLVASYIIDCVFRYIPVIREMVNL